MITRTILQPGGGQVKIAVRKLEWKAVTKTNANNEKYLDKKVHPILSCHLYLVIYFLYVFTLTKVLLHWTLFL